MASLTLAGIVYLLALREFFATQGFSRRLVVIGLGLAAVWNVAFLRLPAGVDDDIHRYVWDGRLQRLGYNPYLVIPSDPAVQELHTPETRNLNNPDLPSDRDSGVQLCTEGSVCRLRVRDYFRVARYLALYPAGSASSSGICMESIAGH
jgi:hypothetical protein